MTLRAQTKRKRGRPTSYSDAIAREILDRLAAGESLRSICRDEHMPDEARVRQWACNDGVGVGDEKLGVGFSPQYARARQIGYEYLVEDILEIGDKSIVTGPDGLVDNASVQAARLQCDNRKWLLSKLLPRQFGDKVTAEIQGDPNAPLVTRIELVPVAPLARTRIDNSIAIEHDDGYDGGSDPSGRNKP